MTNISGWEEHYFTEAEKNLTLWGFLLTETTKDSLHFTHSGIMEKHGVPTSSFTVDIAAFYSVNLGVLCASVVQKRNIN
jgi:hypothetical protein